MRGGGGGALLGAECCGRAPVPTPPAPCSSPGQAEVAARLQLLVVREFAPLRCPALGRECASVATHGKEVLSRLSLHLLKKIKSGRCFMFRRAALPFCSRPAELEERWWR